MDDAEDALVIGQGNQWAQVLRGGMMSFAWALFSHGKERASR
jgi:hypothetical protein